MADRHGAFSWRQFTLGVARRLGIRTRSASDEDLRAFGLDAWSSEPTAPVDNGLSQLLAELEERALTVYARAGLPTRRGHYARAPDDRAWQFLAEQMPPADRWALVQDYPPEQGWRFATLRTVGLYESAGSPAFLAAEVLSECRALRDSPEGRYDGTMALLERSIRLGITSACLGLGDKDQPVGHFDNTLALPDGQGDLFDPPSP